MKHAPVIAAMAALALIGGCKRSETAPAEELGKAAEQALGEGAAEPVPVADGPFAPRDTCDTVEGSRTFRDRLAAVVAARDVPALRALAADDITLDFGGGMGAAELEKRLEDPEWRLWEELAQVLKMGCSANAQGGITMPWYADQQVDIADPGSGMIVTGENVPLLETPDAKARQLAVVSWDVVTLSTLDPDAEFQRVEAADGTTGFISTDKLRSLLDYRVTASKRNGKWSITSFVAGD